MRAIFDDCQDIINKNKHEKKVLENNLKCKY